MRLARAETLLVASDFDGTLAPIVDHPDQVEADRDAVRALEALARLPDTHVAVISGRSIDVLRGFLGEAASRMRLAGSHGAEGGDEGDAGTIRLTRDQRRALERAVARLEELAGRHQGALVERKPLGVAFHYRRVSDEAREGVAREARALLRDSGAGIRPGHEVVELSMIEADKGRALESLRRDVGATATLFVGDDVTDEDAFERLGASDLGVKVGPGETRADARIESQEEVARLFRRLHELRRRARPPLLAALLAAAAGCGGGGGGATGPAPPPPPPPGGISRIVLDPEAFTLSSVGETRAISVTARSAGGSVVPGVAFSWRSSNTAVATVDDQGLVTAVANGTAAIEASASGVTGRANAAVRAGELRWLALSAGGINGCGVTSHGTAYCWGDDVHGQIGDGETANWRVDPTRVVAPLLYFQHFTIGGGHACALTSDAAAYCWGNTFFGEGGYGVSGEAVQTSPVQVSGGHRFAELEASGSHTCGLTTSGAAYCWGINGQGQLGDGTTTNRDAPVPVAGGLTFERISAPTTPVDNHTCAVTPEGDAYCWGTNFDGELGDGTTNHSPTPVVVGGGLAFDRVSAGGRHTCALTPAGAAYCWGANDAGALGDGTTQARAMPTAVSGGIVFRSISAGENHTCGVATDGTAYCWGANSEGQLGDGTNQSRTVPTPVSGGLTFVQLESGPVHVCGLAVSGTGYCWGRNTRAELGDGTTVPRNAPVALPAPDEIG